VSRCVLWMVVCRRCIALSQAVRDVMAVVRRHLFGGCW